MQYYRSQRSTFAEWSLSTKVNSGQTMEWIQPTISTLTHIKLLVYSLIKPAIPYTVNFLKDKMSSIK